MIPNQPSIALVRNMQLAHLFNLTCYDSMSKCKDTGFNVFYRHLTFADKLFHEPC